jgi:hypothetical protein
MNRSDDMILKINEEFENRFFFEKHSLPPSQINTNRTPTYIPLPPPPQTHLYIHNFHQFSASRV